MSSGRTLRQPGHLSRPQSWGNWTEEPGPTPTEPTAELDPPTQVESVHNPYNRRMAFDSEQARRFIDLGDRDFAPFFAGRAAEIRHFESSFNTLTWKEKRSAAFRIFQGAPGCGKTSLVQHLRHLYADDVLFVDIDDEDLVSKESLTRQIREKALSFGSLRGGLAAFAQMVGTYLRVTRPGSDEVRNFVADHATRDKKVVLFMDEAQVFGEDQQPGLVLLHTTGLGFPTVALLAGLSHTAGRLRSIGGISRLAANAVINMGAMSESECVDSTGLLLDACGVIGRQFRAGSNWCRTVARFVAWLAAAPERLATGPMSRATTHRRAYWTEVDLGVVRSESDRTRRDYYQIRLSDTVLDMVPAATARIVAKVTETRPDRMYELEGVCEEVIVDMGLDKDTRFRTNAEQIAKALVERGVLAIADGGSYDVAIPSMLDYLHEVSRPASAS